MSLNLQQVSDLHDTLDLTAGEAEKLFRVSHKDAVIRQMYKVRNADLKGWRVVWVDPEYVHVIHDGIHYRFYPALESWEKLEHQWVLVTPPKDIGEVTR